jgi:hypothetical protein
VGDRHVLRWVVLAVDPVRHVGRIGQRLKAMRAAGRDVKRGLFGVPQLEALPVTVGRGCRAQVNDDVEDRPVGAADELRLAWATAQVQAAQDAAARAGNTVLDERGRINPGRPHHRRVEGPAEEAALVHVRSRSQQQCAGYPRHGEYLHNTSRVAMRS